jgi:PhzF family phenazine biosynthesis protein
MDVFIVDAFTDQPFSANPAGVVLLKSGFPDDEWMQNMAAELNLSETAFLHPFPPAEFGDRAAPDWALRWSTPVAEVSLCGHATLAAAHVLAHLGRDVDTVRFASRSGVLTARISSDGSVTLDFPAAPATRAAVPSGLADVLGAFARLRVDYGRPG